MCAIVGYSVYDRKKYERNLALVLATFAGAWAAAESRGSDASGIFIVDRNGTGEIHKSTAKPWEILGLLNIARIKKGIGIVAHTRQATSGSPSKNGNNHPITFGKITGVHNGVLFGYARLKEKYGCSLEVDSEVLMAILNRADDDITGVKRIIEEVNGSVAMAWVREGQPHISLYSNGLNDLYLIPDLDKGVVFFCSLDQWVASPCESYLLEPECYIKLEEGSVKRVLLPTDVFSDTGTMAGTPKLLVQKKEGAMI